MNFDEIYNSFESEDIILQIIFKRIAQSLSKFYNPLDVEVYYYPYDKRIVASKNDFVLFVFGYNRNVSFKSVVNFHLSLNGNMEINIYPNTNFKGYLLSVYKKVNSSNSDDFINSCCLDISECINEILVENNDYE